MLRNVLIVCNLSLLVSGSVFAQVACSCAGGERLNDGQIVSALGGKTACAVLGTESWKEFHSGNSVAGGSLIETGRTPNEGVGSWSVIGNGANATISYNYGSGGTYAYEVCTQGANIHFCGAKNITNVTINNGQGGC